MKARLAVDIGGTFTDVALEQGERRWTVKTLTTSKAPAEGVLDGIGQTLDQAGLKGDDVALVIHGTTLATNAILERKGAVTTLITTEGFRDVLEIGYETRFDQYDLMLEKPKPLVPRERRLTVPERVDVQGRVLTPLDEGAVLKLLPRLDALGVESVAIGFLHAYANPAHERRAAELLRAERPDLGVTLSSEVCPEIREYERFTTTAANAYVRPLISDYLGELGERLEAAGISAPLLLMTSGGGLTTLETARKLPIRLVESGPAGGAILASQVAASLGLDKVLSFDMGGTTAKICLIEDGEPESAREFEVDRSARFIKGSGLPLRIPVIEMVEIGAGGGSIARLDTLGRITVGPDSAGADPGPAAYGQGGGQPTVTDADTVLGKIDPAAFAGGKVALDPELAARAIARTIGEPMGLTAELGAFGVQEMVDETMASAARVHTVERGKVVADHAMVAFGGAAPLHAARLAEKLGITQVVVPPDAGVGSAIGFLRAPIAYEVVQSRHQRLRHFDADAINALFADMHAEAEAVVRQGAPDAKLVETRLAHMRYYGQGHEVVVTLPNRALATEDAALLQARFDDTYRQIYRRIIPNAEVEILTFGLTLATGSVPLQALQNVGVASTCPEPRGARSIF
ncbi:MAG: hydantoinase/oxoprolinase family protein, partial [Alphaproteobacteria bacterium]|nr:hydantoinase/oxoprolinase family protein [Alphaproteobacteria bacterium]